MKSRLTAWLAALLMLSAIIGLPVTRGATNRVSCYQVYCERREDRVEQTAEARPTYSRRPLTASALPEPVFARLRNHSLFQRPPPALRLQQPVVNVAPAAL